MHESRLMQSIVERVLERARQAHAVRVRQVDLAITPTGHLSEEGARRHFAALAAGTIAADAVLVVTAMPGNYFCLGCDHRFSSFARDALCPDCSSPALALPGQDGCYLGTIKVTCVGGEPALW